MDLSELDRLTKQNEVADILRRARDSIRDPKRWSRGISDSGPGKACSWVAINRKDFPLEMNLAAANYLSAAIGLRSNDLVRIFDWNDAAERTHAEVLSAFARAIELAERGA